MSYVISQYKEQIKVLNPLEDSKFIYDSVRWNKLNNEAKTLVSAYENKEISRKDVIKAFADFYEGKKEYLYPFVITMIWGFANTGYGTFRTNKYLDSHENKAHIKSAFNYIAEGNINKAYHLLMKIDGLNVSYVSKLLYFATRARNQANYALIFDIRVARAMVRLLDSGITEFLDIKPSSKYKDFESYNALIHKWANELNVEAENVEMFLFNGGF
jgi:hypothetical protein